MRPHHRRRSPRPLVFEVSCACQPVSDPGGDIWELVPLGEGRSAWFVADVVGKGRSAASLRRRVLAAFRRALTPCSLPAEVCTRLNRDLCCGFTDAEFATGFYAEIDRRRGWLRYTRAGHTPAFLARADGTVIRLDTGGGILGAFTHLGFEQGEVELRAGDRILIYTDGLTEARDARGRELGEGAVAWLLGRHRGLDAAGLRQALTAALAGYSEGNLADDVTIGVLAVDGAPSLQSLTA